MKIRVNLSLDPEVLAALAKLSALNRRSQSQYVEDLVIKADMDFMTSQKSNRVKEDPLPYGEKPDPILDFMKRIENEMASVKGQISELKSKKKK